ncbi:MAG: efflux RND transporter periplasmic adaptor subunit [Acidobacteriota bacterium]
MTAQKRILVITAAVLTLAAIIGFSINANRKDQVTVESEKVQRRQELVSRVSSTGQIKPKEYVELQSEIAGVITSLYIKEGDSVQRGGLLLKIDPTQSETETRAQQALLDGALAEARNQKAQILLQETTVQRDQSNVALMKAELQRAEKALEIARSSFERKQQLFEDNLISRDDYDAARNELFNAETTLVTTGARLDQANAQLTLSEVALGQSENSYVAAQSRVEQHRAILERAHDLLSKTIIRSPLSGVITQLNVEVGERAVPGTLNNPSATLMVIADLSVIEAEVEVDETDVVHVALGQTAEVTVDALPDTPLQGIITEVGSSAIELLAQNQQEARDFKVTIQLKNPPAVLRPGLSCIADITTATRTDVLAIPIQALTMREAGEGENGQKKESQGVFVIFEEKAKFVPIQTGITGDTEIEVTSGLQEGAVIVTGSYQTLRTLKDGDNVKIEDKEKT